MYILKNNHCYILLHVFLVSDDDVYVLLLHDNYLFYLTYILQKITYINAGIKNTVYRYYYYSLLLLLLSFSLVVSIVVYRKKHFRVLFYFSLPIKIYLYKLCKILKYTWKMIALRKRKDVKKYIYTYTNIYIRIINIGAALKTGRNELLTKVAKSS